MINLRNSASQERENFLSELEEMVKHPRVVAVGETGLDYYRLASKQEESEVSQTTFGAASFTTTENEIRWENRTTVTGADLSGKPRRIIRSAAPLPYCFGGSESNGEKKFSMPKRSKGKRTIWSCYNPAG
jgi:hypothetical protein